MNNSIGVHREQINEAELIIAEEQVVTVNKITSDSRRPLNKISRDVGVGGEDKIRRQNKIPNTNYEEKFVHCPIDGIELSHFHSLVW